MYSVTYILMYTAVVVIEHIHTKKYQVVGLIPTTWYFLVCMCSITTTAVYIRIYVTLYTEYG